MRDRPARPDQAPPRSSWRSHLSGRAGRLAATYAVIAAVWIVVSSWLLENVSNAADFEIVKGLAFVVATAGVLFVVLVAHGRVTEEAAERMRRLIESAGDVAFRYRIAPPVGFDYISDRITDWFGLTPEDHYRDPDLDVWLVHPEDRQELANLLAIGTTSSSVHLRWVLPDGRMLHTEHDVREVRDRRGRVIAVDGRIRNVTDERRDRAESAIAEAVLASAAARVADDVVAHHVCERIVALMEIDLAWIGAPLGDGTVATIASAGDWGCAADGGARWDEGPLARDYIGTSIRDRRPVVMSPTEPGYAPWRQRAMEAGVASSLAVPIVRDDRTIGVLSVSSRLGNPFDAAHVERFARTAERLGMVMSGEHRRAAAQHRASHGGESQDDSSVDPVFDVVDALASGRIEPFWQPQLASVTGQVVSLEALVRGRTRDGAVVPPNELLALAEEHGVMVPLGRMLRRAACSQIGRWRDLGVERVALNASVTELVEPGFALEITSLLSDHHIAPGVIEIEIVETAPLDARAVRTIIQLAEAGIRIAVDDYGSGWASLGHLAQLPASTLKIDRVFIRDVGTSRRADELVRSTFELARNLDLVAVAEGVETAAQARRLRSMGCDLLQGFLFARPMPVDDTAAFINRHRASIASADDWIDAVAEQGEALAAAEMP